MPIVNFSQNFVITMEEVRILVVAPVLCGVESNLSHHVWRGIYLLMVMINTTVTTTHVLVSCLLARANISEDLSLPFWFCLLWRVWTTLQNKISYQSQNWRTRNKTKEIQEKEMQYIAEAAIRNQISWPTSQFKVNFYRSN